MLAALLAFAFLSPLVAGPSVTVWQQLVSWICLVGWLLCAPALVWPASELIRWLGASAVVLVLTGIWGGTGWPFAFPLAVLVATALAAGLGASSSNSDTSVPTAMAWGLFGAGLLNAVLGLFQYYGLAGDLASWFASPPAGRAWGTLRQRNQFATLLSLALVAMLWLYGTRDSRQARWGLMAAAVVLIAAAAASLSRTGLLQFVLVMAVASAAAWRERRGKVISGSFRLPPPFVLLAGIPLYFAFAAVLPYLAAGSDGWVAAAALTSRLQPAVVTTDSRIVLWQNVLSLIAQRPLTGWGWGELSFAHFATLYNGPRFPVILDNAHNLPLHLAVELGIPAAVLICGGFLWMVGAAKPWRERDPLRLMAWGLLGVILLHSLLEYPLWYGPFQLVFGLCLGILWPASPKRPKAISRKLTTFAAAAWIAVIGYAAWDYTRISQIYLPREARLPAYRDDTLAKLQGSWLFSRQVDFAELTLTAVTPANAAQMHALAARVVHFSPEPRVIVKLIESAELVGRDAEAHMWAQRFRAAFPIEFARWLEDRPDDAPEL
ncbi:PglL family O-oligosaccharyltransferase [Variovorax boronicumulans]